MHKTILRTVSFIMVIFLSLGNTTFGQAKSRLAESASTFVAEADARVEEASPDTNYGMDGSLLYVQGGTNPDIESYLRFTVAGLSGTVTSARLRVYVTQDSSNGPTVYMTGSDWAETGITWNSRPARSSNAGEDKGALAANTWAEYDVTAFVPGNGTFSFVLATDSVDSLALSSREGSFPAQLVVTTSDGAANTLPSPTLVAASATPTTAPATVVPFATPTAVNTPIPTVTAIQPSPTASTTTGRSLSLASSQLLASDPITTGSMWISQTELMSLPTSGAAWDKMRTTAYGSWGTADLKNQDNKHAIYTLAGALVYARTGDASLRTKVQNAILAAKRSLDSSAEWQTVNGELAASRQLAAYVISADLINLKSFNATADSEFRNWLSAIRTTDVGTHGRWRNIRYTCENAAGNWNSFACASRIAASIYLGDTADVQRSATIIRALFGERSYYPKDAPGADGYFQHTAGYLTSWTCDEATWRGINPGCLKSNVNLSGAVVEDVSRGGGCCVAVGSGISYSWESLQGFFISAELLYRTGAYGDPYSWSNQALKRSLDFMKRSGWGVTHPATYVPWMANFRYKTTYPVTTSSDGRDMSWGDWLYKR